MLLDGKLTRCQDEEMTRCRDASASKNLWRTGEVKYSIKGRLTSCPVSIKEPFAICNFSFQSQDWMNFVWEMKLLTNLVLIYLVDDQQYQILMEYKKWTIVFFPWQRSRWYTWYGTNGTLKSWHIVSISLLLGSLFNLKWWKRWRRIKKFCWR